MKDLQSRFEKWYKLTHWMAPPLTRRGDDTYEHQVVQGMYIAYRAGFNRANKEARDLKKEQA